MWSGALQAEADAIGQFVAGSLEDLLSPDMPIMSGITSSSERLRLACVKAISP
jgi:hypothetical protein